MSSQFDNRDGNAGDGALRRRDGDNGAAPSPEQEAEDVEAVEIVAIDEVVREHSDRPKSGEPQPSAIPPRNHVGATEKEEQPASPAPRTGKRPGLKAASAGGVGKAAKTSLPRSQAAPWWRNFLGILDILATALVSAAAFLFGIPLLADGLSAWRWFFFFIPMAVSLFTVGILYLRSAVALKEVHFGQSQDDSGSGIAGMARRAFRFCDSLHDGIFRFRGVRLATTILWLVASLVVAYLIFRWLWDVPDISPLFLILPCYFCLTSFRELGSVFLHWRRHKEWIGASPGSRRLRYAVLAGTCSLVLVLAVLHAYQSSSQRGTRITAERRRSARQQPAAARSDRTPSSATSAARDRQDDLEDRRDQAKRELQELEKQYQAYLQGRARDPVDKMNQKEQEIAKLRSDIRKRNQRLREGKIAEYRTIRETWLGTGVPMSGPAATVDTGELFGEAISRIGRNREIAGELAAMMAGYPSNVVRIATPNKPGYDNGKGNVLVDAELTIDA